MPQTMQQKRQSALNRLRAALSTYEAVGRKTPEIAQKITNLRRMIDQTEAAIVSYTGGAR